MSDNDDIRVLEEELRAAFVRHEPSVIAAEPLSSEINSAVVRRRRRRLALRLTGAALAVLVAVGLPVYGRTLAIPASTGIEMLTGFPAGPSTPAVPDRALNFLLLGLDGRAGEEAERGLRADTVLIVHLPKDQSRFYLISLPRDLGVDLPGLGRAKLSEAFFYGSERKGAAPDLAGGIKLTTETVSAATGLRVDGTAAMTFDGLRALTDAVGGVSICLPERIPSSHTERVFPAGCQRLDGRAALDLLRQRYGLPEGANDRDRNGQRYVKALLAELTGSDAFRDPVKLSGILNAASNGLTLELAGREVTDFIGVLAAGATADPVGIGWESDPDYVDDRYYERLDPVLSAGLFEAAREDKLADWVAANPDRITR